MFVSIISHWKEIWMWYVMSLNQKATPGYSDCTNGQKNGMGMGIQIQSELFVNTDVKNFLKHLSGNTRKNMWEIIEEKEYCLTGYCYVQPHLDPDFGFSEPPLRFQVILLKEKVTHSILVVVYFRHVQFWHFCLLHCSVKRVSKRLQMKNIFSCLW